MQLIDNTNHTRDIKNTSDEIKINADYKDKDYNKEDNNQGDSNQENSNQENYNQEDIAKIEKDVIELVEVFNTVQDLVIQQADTINIIEDNIDNANEYVVITHNDLDEIEKIKKKMANKKTIIYSVGVLMISIPISVLAGPFAGISFAVLGVGSIKGYSSYTK